MMMQTKLDPMNWVTSEPEVLSKSFRAFLLGVEDVVGNKAMPGILRQAQLVQYIGNYPPATAQTGGHLQRYISQINQVLFDIYGARGSRAILQRVGRGQAALMMEQDAHVTAAVKLGLRIAPERFKVKLLLERAAQEIGARMNTAPKVFEDGQVYFYEDTACPYCLGWHHSAAVCFTVAGFLRQVLHHIAEIDNVLVEETHCRAKGDASCLFRIRVPQAE